MTVNNAASWPRSGPATRHARSRLRGACARSHTAAALFALFWPASSGLWRSHSFNGTPSVRPCIQVRGPRSPDTRKAAQCCTDRALYVRRLRGAHPTRFGRSKRDVPTTPAALAIVSSAHSRALAHPIEERPTARFQAYAPLSLLRSEVIVGPGAVARPAEPCSPQLSLRCCAPRPRGSGSWPRPRPSSRADSPLSPRLPSRAA